MSDMFVNGSGRNEHSL